MEEELLLDKNRNRQVKRLFSKTKGDGYGLFLGGRSGDDEREEIDVTYCAALGGAFGGERVMGSQNYLFNLCLLSLNLPVCPFQEIMKIINIKSQYPNASIA